MAVDRAAHHQDRPQPPGHLPDGERHGQMAEGEGEALAQAGADDGQAAAAGGGEGEGRVVAAGGAGPGRPDREPPRQRQLPAREHRRVPAEHHGDGAGGERRGPRGGRGRGGGQDHQHTGHGPGGGALLPGQAPEHDREPVLPGHPARRPGAGAGKQDRPDHPPEHPAPAAPAAHDRAAGPGGVRPDASRRAGRGRGLRQRL